jgi:hypothetical protein
MRYWYQSAEEPVQENRKFALVRADDPARILDEIDAPGWAPAVLEYAAKVRTGRFPPGTVLRAIEEPGGLKPATIDGDIAPSRRSPSSGRPRVDSVALLLGPRRASLQLRSLSLGIITDGAWPVRPPSRVSCQRFAANGEVRVGRTPAEKMSDLMDVLANAGWWTTSTQLWFVDPDSPMPRAVEGWSVLGVHGEHQIAALGTTQLEAWQAACERARRLGML